MQPGAMINHREDHENHEKGRWLSSWLQRPPRDQISKSSKHKPRYRRGGRESTGWKLPFCQLILPVLESWRCLVTVVALGAQVCAGTTVFRRNGDTEYVCQRVGENHRQVSEPASATSCRTSKVARAASRSLRFIPRALGPIQLAHREDHAGRVSDRGFCDGWSSNSTLNCSTAARTTRLPWRAWISETATCAGILTVEALACCRCLPDILPIWDQCRYLSLDLQVQTCPSVSIDGAGLRHNDVPMIFENGRVLCTSGSFTRACELPVLG